MDVRPRLSYESLDLLGVSGAGVPLTSPQIHSSCHTDDLRQALLYISHRYPQAPLLGLGFSLGANILTRYVAEEGEECRLISACALACVSSYLLQNIALFKFKILFQPWDLAANSIWCVYVQCLIHISDFRSHPS